MAPFMFLQLVGWFPKIISRFFYLLVMKLLTSDCSRFNFCSFLSICSLDAHVFSGEEIKTIQAYSESGRGAQERECVCNISNFLTFLLWVWVTAVA